jgi:hypothetical protein
MQIFGKLRKNEDGNICLEMQLSSENLTPELVEIGEIFEEFLDQTIYLRVDRAEIV